jgi:DMSO/TMAO reductase YedYZ molybdopterin-dependent catalytic subunit
MVRSPRRTGALLGLLLTLPLTALMGLASAATGVRFPPFDLFEWLIRILPGRLVAFGIDALVAVLGALDLSLRTASKTAEQALALALFMAGGIVAGLLLGAWFGRGGERTWWPRSMAAAGAAGLLIGVAVPASAATAAGPAPPAAAAAWIVIAFLAWGALFGLAWRRLGERPAAAIDRRPAFSTNRVPLESRQPPVLQSSDRRRFLVQVGGAAAVVTVGGAAVARVLRPGFSGASTAGAPQPFPARVGAIVPAPGTRPELTRVEDHYRIDIDLLPPSIDGRAWDLPITGLVDRPARLTLDGFERGAYGPAQHLFVTLECISNPVGGDLIGTTRWTGVPLRAVLEPLGPKAAARYASIRSQDGFHEVVPLDLAMNDARVMLAYQWDGRPLPAAHGFPLRIYVPDRYGMKQPKWITSIELTDRNEPGYWVERGWSREARVQTTSVIDTVAVQAVYEKGGKQFVPIGGIAYAGARSVSRVQVKVDGGPWSDAAVGQPLSGLTWAIWRYDWAFEPGTHTFAVRAVDGFGQPQVEREQPPEPDGATGLFRVTKRV